MHFSKVRSAHAVKSFYDLIAIIKDESLENVITNFIKQHPLALFYNKEKSKPS
jgi:hypothetical protein